MTLSTQVHSHDSNGAATQIRVQNDGEYYYLLPVTYVVKQGHFMAPTLLSMIFSAMFTDVYQDCDTSCPIKHGLNGKLFNLRRLYYTLWIRNQTKFGEIDCA